MKRLLFILCLFLVGCTKEEVIIEENSQLDKMTLDEKIAQMMIITYPGDVYDEKLESLIKDFKPGGFILMSDNITSYDNTLSLVKKMNNDSSIPLFISIDEEGGSVSRTANLTDINVTSIPDMYSVGSLNDLNIAYEIGEITAKKVRTLGVNVDFAPVLDIYSNPNNSVIGLRSFGSDKVQVSKMALSFKDGLEDNLVMGCVKHFPGHGSTDVDSHFDIPMIDKSYNELLNNEFYPFKKAIKDDIKMIMIGHIALPKITNDLTPATLSKEIITDILINKLNYHGLIITDGLNMGALVNNYSPKEIYVNAVKAGNDILLMPLDPIEALNDIKSAIENEEISIDQINNSVEKILDFKSKYIKENYLDKSFLSKDYEVLNNFK